MGSGIVTSRSSMATSTALSAGPDLSTFVERDRSEEIRAWMRAARIDGGFLVVVGDSSVGKTRLLYETAREVLPDLPCWLRISATGPGAPPRRPMPAGGRQQAERGRR
jgi:hypothetical protein